MANRPRRARRRPPEVERFGGWYPPTTKPRPADGIRARSRRGDIGESWWSRRFIEILESFDMGTRLTRGRHYARAGQVLGLDIAPGEVTAQVQGSRRLPYRVRIGTLVISRKDWSRVEEVMASRAVFLAKLLAGEMPHDIEQAFTDTRLTLFPSSIDDLSTDCSCPDWANPCKHIAATYYLLAEAFDEDPFLIFRWRGRDREELLGDLLARPAADSAEAQERSLWDVPEAGVASLDELVDRYWAPAEPEGLNVTARYRPTDIPDAILRGLEPGMIDVAGTPLADVLAPAYAAITAAAVRAALRDEGT